MQYKLIEAPEVKMTGDGHGFITGYASTFGNFDDVHERVVKGAFAAGLTEFLRDGFIAVGHNWSALPIATPVEAYEDETGLRVVGEFHSTDDAQKARTVIRERLDRGKSVKLSIGYEVLADEYVEQGRLLKQLKLFEWSYVTVPANQQAVVTDAKAQSLSLEEHTRTVLAAVAYYKERMTDLLVLRQKERKEGRVFSAANVARLQGVLDSLDALDEVRAALRDILAAAQPKADPKAIDALYIEFQRIQASINGALNQ